MILLDVNILVSAHRADADQHREIKSWLETVLSDPAGVACGRRADVICNESSRDEQRADANILVDVIPNSDTAAYEAPVCALFGRGAKKAQEPRQRS